MKIIYATIPLPTPSDAFAAAGGLREMLQEQGVATDSGVERLMAERLRHWSASTDRTAALVGAATTKTGPLRMTEARVF